MTLSDQLIRGFESSRVASGIALVVTAGDSDRGQDIQRALQIQGYRVEFASSYEQSLDHLAGRRYDLLVVHVRRWDRATQNFLATAKMGHPEQPIALVGSRSNVKKSNELIGASRFYSLTEFDLGRAISKSLSENKVGPIPSQKETLYALLNSAAATAEGGDVSTAIKALWPAIVSLTSASDAVVHTLTPGAEYLRVAVRFSSVNRRGQQTRLSAIALRIARKAIKHRQVFTPLQNDERFSDLGLEEFGLEQVSSWPLICNSQVVGAVTIFHREYVAGRDTSANDLLIKLLQFMAVLVQRAHLMGMESETGQSSDLRDRQAAVGGAATTSDQRVDAAPQDTSSDSLRRLLGHLVGREMPEQITIDRYADWLEAVAERVGLESDSDVRDLAYLRDIGAVVKEQPLTGHGESRFRRIASRAVHPFGGGEGEQSSQQDHQEDRGHAIEGSQLLTDMEFSKDIIAAVRHQHENYDGSGHPDGLREDAIPLLARTLRVLDGFVDVFGTAQHEGQANPDRAAQDSLLAESGRLYDPVVVQAFLETLEQERKQSPASGSLTDDQMYSIISHELRSPLSLLMGHAEQLVREEDLPVDAAERVRELHDEVIRMSRLLGRLQDDPNSDGEEVVFREEIDLNEIVAQALEYSAQQHTGYEVEFSGTPGPAMVLGDEVRLLQVVSNLLDNAVKYSPACKDIEINLRRDGSDFVISVADLGIGVPENLRDEIFERSYRVANELTQEMSGQGIGLSLAKTIVEAHHGRIWIDWTDREERVGSTFSFALPAMPESE